MLAACSQSGSVTAGDGEGVVPAVTVAGVVVGVAVGVAVAVVGVGVGVAVLPGLPAAPGCLGVGVGVAVAAGERVAVTLASLKSRSRTSFDRTGGHKEIRE